MIAFSPLLKYKTAIKSYWIILLQNLGSINRFVFQVGQSIFKTKILQLSVLASESRQMLYCTCVQRKERCSKKYCLVQKNYRNIWAKKPGELLAEEVIPQESRILATSFTLAINTING